MATAEALPMGSGDFAAQKRAKSGMALAAVGKGLLKN
jgi:hypothetical protein